MTVVVAFRNANNTYHTMTAVWDGIKMGHTCATFGRLYLGARLILAFTSACRLSSKNKKDRAMPCPPNCSLVCMAV